MTKQLLQIQRQENVVKTGKFKIENYLKINSILVGGTPIPDLTPYIENIGGEVWLNLKLLATSGYDLKLPINIQYNP